MGGFEISAQLNANKVFLVKHRDLINRIDPYYYKGTFHNLRKKLLAKNFVRLSTFVNSWNRGDGPRDGFYTDNSKLGVYFLRVNNLQKHSIELEDVKYINRAIHETKLRRTQVTAGDVVFAISGTKDNLGTVSIIPNNISEANLNSALVRFDLNQRIDKKFFCILFDLDFVRTQIEFTGKGAAQNNLNNDEISSFLLPNLDLSIQKSLVKSYETAQRNQLQKEQEANVLLESIDTYLLNELGISLPEQDNSLEKRMFSVSFSEMIGQRIDPFHSLKYKLLFSQTGKYPFVPFKELLSGTPQYGANEEGKERESKDDVRYIRITDIDELGILKNKSWKTAENIEEQYLLKENDILFARSGSVGRCYIHKEIKLPAIFAGYLIRFKTNVQKLTPDFLFYYCNSVFYKSWVNAIARPGVQANINAEEYKSLLIPLPPVEKQNEIVAHITQIRTQAKQLQTEAAQILNNAKVEIEQMILGNDA